MAKMNLAIRRIDGRIEQGDTFLDDRFPDLKADFILANPPFNMIGARRAVPLPIVAAAVAWTGRPPGATACKWQRGGHA